MFLRSAFTAVMASATLIAPLAASAADDNPYLGRWALTIPGAGAGWLGVNNDNGFLDAGILWGGGSVVPVSHVYMDGDELVVTRTSEKTRRDASGKEIAKHTITETIRAKANGDKLMLTRIAPKDDGSGVTEQEFTGTRIAPLPDTPNLAQLEYGEPINLLSNPNELTKWEPMGSAKSGWSLQDGVLKNDPVQEKGKPHINYANLRTKDEFEDFKLEMDVNVPKGSNSGVYLRGIYEVQVLDSYGKPADSHNMGGIYSRITPSKTVEKPAGEWQHFEIILADRHATVKLNGETIIDNAPLEGVTGGAMTSDEFKPGPIYLQGDHGKVSYRNIVLTPIEN
ncbi:MAG: DUF1080 domain-containing protein [Candidatus Hydrogenedentales bacterium]